MRNVNAVAVPSLVSFHYKGILLFNLRCKTRFYFLIYEAWASFIKALMLPLVDRVDIDPKSTLTCYVWVSLKAFSCLKRKVIHK